MESGGWAMKIGLKPMGSILRIGVPNVGGKGESRKGSNHTSGESGKGLNHTTGESARRITDEGVGYASGSMEVAARESPVVGRANAESGLNPSKTAINSLMLFAIIFPLLSVCVKAP